MKKLQTWLTSRRALSPIFATLLLVGIVITFGTVTYFYVSNVTSTATNDYVSSVADSKQTISERIGFENVVYTSNPANLRFYIINCGSTNNLQLNALFVYNSNQQLVGYSGDLFTNSPLRDIDVAGNPIAGNSLSIGEEAYFDAKLTKTGADTVASLSAGVYSIHLITKGEGRFDYQFVIS